MKRTEYETELKALYRMAIKHNDARLALEILKLGTSAGVDSMQVEPEQHWAYQTNYKLGDKMKYKLSCKCNSQITDSSWHYRGVCLGCGETIQITELTPSIEDILREKICHYRVTVHNDWPKVILLPEKEWLKFIAPGHVAFGPIDETRIEVTPDKVKGHFQDIPVFKYSGDEIRLD